LIPLRKKGACLKGQINNRKKEKPIETILGILIPFLGTTMGAVCVLFMKNNLGNLTQRCLAGFAAGVMVAASVWSLLIPAIEQSASMGALSFVPAFAGFWFGVLFLLALDHLIPHLHVGSEQSEGPKSKLSRTTMMVLAVTLHNIPEGMAVGVMYAGFLSGNAQITAASALALSLGIAIQNFPEGAIISMPLRAEGMSRRKAFAGGVVSGIVEPIGAVLTIIASQLIIAALPYLLSFAAGAMLYVVVEELMPELSQGKHSNLGTVFFAIGFSLMMVLDVALG
jgi:ZIP family zinc transporter